MAAAKGNTYAKGCETSGRPLIFATVADLEEAVDHYFSVDGDAWVDGEFMPTMSGLALALGIDRRTLTLYATRDEYYPVVRKARALVEQCLERKLYSGQVAGVIFNLKNNFGWADKQEIDHLSTDGSLTPKPAIDKTLVDALVNKLID